MTSVINFYGKSFSIGFSEADNARRTAYFKRDLGTLTPQEKSLILSIGIDAQMENALKPYLADFFSSLQTCSSDTSLILNKDCETAYFVIWSTLFANNKEVHRRAKQRKDPFAVVGDEDLAQTGALISGLNVKPVPTPRFTGSDKQAISSLFKLIFVKDTPERQKPMIDSLFNLIFVEVEPSNENNSESITSVTSTSTVGSRTASTISD
jgi:hypothetical protein